MLFPGVQKPGGDSPPAGAGGLPRVQCVSSPRVCAGSLGASVPATPTPDRPSPPSAELHGKLQSSEAEVRGKCEELRSLHGQLDEARGHRTRSSQRGSAPSRPCWRPARPRMPRSAPSPQGPSTHPTGPLPDDPPSEACVLVTTGLFSFQASRVEADQQQARKRGQGPAWV